MHLHCTAWERAFCLAKLSKLLLAEGVSEVAGGSETKINNPNLDEVLSLIKRFVKDGEATLDYLGTTPLLVMSSKVKSEKCIKFEGKLCLGSEAKGRHASSAVAHTQSLSLGTEIAVNLLRCGIPAAGFAVPILTTFGHGEF